MSYLACLRRPPTSAPRRTVVIAFLVAALISFGNKHAAAQTGENVLVVVNDASPDGDKIARKYAEHRGIPAANICRVTTVGDETISRVDYQQQIEGPVWHCIASQSAQDRIVYLVLTKGMPIRIAGTGGTEGTVASVDSELTLLYRRSSGTPARVTGVVRNPFFAGKSPALPVKPFSHASQDLFLVTRLDGYTVDDALALIDRGAAPSRDGRFVLDGRAELFESGNAWLRQAAAALKIKGLGDRTLLDESSTVVVKQSGVLGYYSWGSNDPAIRIRHFDMKFAPGALAAMFVSTDARTLKEPPPDWRPGEWSDKSAYFSGSPQSLIGDLIRDGVTGVAGHVAEPYLYGTIRPDILFPAYVMGANLAEAFYAAMPYVSWQTIVIGDPLCAPFRERNLESREIDGGIDSRTETPVYFARRRLASLPQQISFPAKAAFVRAEARRARNDQDGAQHALLEAVAADSRFTAARLMLAARAEMDGHFDRAVDQFRTVLSYAPNDPTSLNGLAYDLAVHEKLPRDALPYAERAVAVAPASGTVWDTLAWIRHLLGRDSEARVAITNALIKSPEIAAIRWHAAVIFDALGDAARAREELRTLAKLDAASASRTEVKALQERLGPR